mmetsp:Transcript_35567/g.90252  ORF Transcript_35567/g.90252 Transcript_35567/m.90252 type:complete len:228 (+) Transcript_35567:152-835(+)
MAARSSAGSMKVLCERSWYVVGVVDSWFCGSASDSAPICAGVRPMADCSAAGSTEWLAQRSYMPAAGVFGLGWALELLKRAAGTAPLAMADCSSPWLTEWLVDRSYSACVTCLTVSVSPGAADCTAGVGRGETVSDGSGETESLRTSGSLTATASSASGRGGCSPWLCPWLCGVGGGGWLWASAWSFACWGCCGGAGSRLATRAACPSDGSVRWACTAPASIGAGSG